MSEELTWYMCEEPGCPMGFPTLRALSAHRRGHPQKEACDVCGRRFRDLEKHKRRAHQEPEVGPQVSFEDWEALESRDARIRELEGLLAAKQEELDAKAAEADKWHAQRTELHRELRRVRQFAYDQGLVVPPKPKQ